MHHNSQTKQKSRDGEKKRKVAVSKIIWKQAQGDEHENREYRTEDTGAGCIGNQNEYTRGNMIQWRKGNKHSVQVSTAFTNWKFVVFQQVFGGSAWIDWMPEINIWFLLTLVELPAISNSHQSCNWCKEFCLADAPANCGTAFQCSRFCLPILRSEEWAHTYFLKAYQSYPRDGRNPNFHMYLRSWTLGFKSSL